jgi:hypothetical protein
VKGKGVGVRLITTCLLVLAVVVAAVACGSNGGAARSPSPSTPAAVLVPATPAEFQHFSGLTIPASATGVSVLVGTRYDSPSYHVTFTLPTRQVDTFCTDGQLQRPLDVVTIPQSFRDAFDYRGDSSSGVRIGEGSLPGHDSIQRQVLAIGTDTTTSEVRVLSYKLPR